MATMMGGLRWGTRFAVAMSTPLDI